MDIDHLPMSYSLYALQYVDPYHGVVCNISVARGCAQCVAELCAFVKQACLNNRVPVSPEIHLLIFLPREVMKLKF